jgi:tetratricopeptide (TPR) repeat protein
MAQNLHHSGQSNLAISIYRRYVGLEPNDVEGLMGLGELLFELNEPDEACEMHERAISLDPQRVDLRLTFMRQLIKNNQLDQVDKVIGGVLQQLPARRDCLLRHTQLVLKRMPDRTIQVIQFLVRIGDLVALMICAEYMKRYEGRRIIFQLMDKTHKSLKADVLFKNTIDQVVTVEGPDFGFGNPEGPAVYDPGSLWIATTFYHGRYGGQVIPRLHLDPSQYLGPEMEWGKYVVFSPLFDPPYNKPRGMDEAFVNELCDKLYSAVGERAIVITNQPERIYSKIRTISTDNLYDLVYLIGKSKVYLGGDTGFTHFAAAGRVEHLFALYGANYAQDFPSALTNLCFDDTIYAFTAPGKYWGANWDCRPKCDLSKTDLHFHTLQNNRLPMLELDSIIQQVQDILSE